MKNLLIAGLIVMSCGLNAQAEKEVLDSIFSKYKVAFVLYDLNTDKYIYYNKSRCFERFPPMSTYKIPHSLIALETRVLENQNSVIEWDSIKHPREFDITGWYKDQTLHSAIKNSVVWYYQEVAQQVGEVQMNNYIKKINYGNNNVIGDIQGFWFWKLKISAKEQVVFLKKLYLEELEFSKSNMQIVKEIIVLEETKKYTLSGKTGSGDIIGNMFIGWFIGFVETNDNVYFFAMNIENTDSNIVKEKRISLTKNALIKLDIL